MLQRGVCVDHHTDPRDMQPGTHGFLANLHVAFRPGSHPPPIHSGLLDLANESPGLLGYFELLVEGAQPSVVSCFFITITQCEIISIRVVTRVPATDESFLEFHRNFPM